MDEAIILPAIRVSHYRFALNLDEAATLPRYKGSTLRGGFGYAFKRQVCLQRARETCDGCLLRTVCPYGYLFEPSPPPDSEVLSAQSDIPLPFVLEPPLEGRRHYEAGETLGFGLTLVGRAIDFLPYFVMVYRELGGRGLGRDRAKFTLASVEAVDPLADRTATVYSADDEVIRDCSLSAGQNDLVARAETLPATRLTVDFLTPTQLKHGGRFHEQPDFHVLVRALLRRASSLAYFHGGERWETDYRGWIERAGAVRTVAAHTGRMEAWRYSSKQKQRIRLSGAVGQMTYEGDLAPFRPLLALGEWIHVGKACVFGNGMMRVS
jgi:hypothetical protein